MIGEAITKKYIKPTKLPLYGSLATIVNQILPGEKVLDVGCSEGYLATYIPNNQVWGLDGNSSAVQIAKKYCVDAKVFDLNTVPSEPIFDEKFDVIVFADILEHLLYPEQILGHFKHYLRHGGKIIISVPNVALWRVRLNLLLGKFNYTDYGVMDRTHLHLYTFKTARDLIEKADLRFVQDVGAANMLGPIVHYFPVFKTLFSIHVIIIGTT